MILEIIIVLTVILLSMTIHEAMHAFMGYVLAIILQRRGEIDT